jgi:hypothetical protein
VILALTATLAIVVQDRASLRAAPRASATELAALWQGDVLEVRGENAGYLKVYDLRAERGGYLRSEAVRSVGLTEADAPELLAVLRFLRDSPGSEALGVSYGAAYLKAVPTRALTAEPFDAIARMAERLADQASGSGEHRASVAAHLEVVGQFGVRMHSFERSGRMQVCYDGELFRRVLALPGASAEQRARAALGVTRTECIDPNVGPVLRASLDDERQRLLDGIEEHDLSAMTRSRLHVRRAAVWASIAYERARRREPATGAAQRALTELLAVQVDALGDNRRAEYLDAVVRVGAIRWATTLPVPSPGPLTLTAAPGEPGRTCVELVEAAHGARAATRVQRCTYGIVWLASARSIAQGHALVLAVQPLESWRELWVFRANAGGWTVDVLSPGADDPEEGYVEYAGFVPGARRLLIAREVMDHGRFRRRFEELRLDDLALVRQANASELLPEFGRWQDVDWRRDTLALH